jgi:hypothetical protein
MPGRIARASIRSDTSSGSPTWCAPAMTAPIVMSMVPTRLVWLSCQSLCLCEVPGLPAAVDVAHVDDTVVEHGLARYRLLRPRICPEALVLKASTQSFSAAGLMRVRRRLQPVLSFSKAARQVARSTSPVTGRSALSCSCSTAW